MTNAVTPFVRQCVKLWVAENQHLEYFTVTDICNDIYSQHSVLQEIDLTKAVSNELIRLKTIGLIKDVGVFSNPIGRPAKAYELMWCGHSRHVVNSPHAELTMLRVVAGIGKVFVRGQGYVSVFPSHKVHRLDALKTLVEYHKQNA